MIKVSVGTASKAVGKYLDLAHAGHEIVITKRGIPWAMLKPNRPAKKRRNLKKLN